MSAEGFSVGALRTIITTRAERRGGPSLPPTPRGRTWSYLGREAAYLLDTWYSAKGSCFCIFKAGDCCFVLLEGAVRGTAEAAQGWRNLTDDGYHEGEGKCPVWPPTQHTGFQL